MAESVPQEVSLLLVEPSCLFSVQSLRNYLMAADLFWEPVESFRVAKAGGTKERRTDSGLGGGGGGGFRPSYAVEVVGSIQFRPDVTELGDLPLPSGPRL